GWHAQKNNLCEVRAELRPSYCTWITPSDSPALISVTRAMTLRANSYNDCADGEFSPSSTRGLPPSPALRISGSNCTAPRYATSNWAAVFSAPPREQLSVC